MYYANWQLDWGDVDIDLSGMTNLKSITLIDVKFKSLKLPSEISSIEIGDCGVFPDLSNLNNISYLEYYKGGSYDKWSETNILESLKSKVWNSEERVEIEFARLDEIIDLSDILNKFNATSLSIQNCNNVMSLSGIDSMINLTELTLQNDSNLISLDGLNSLENLTTLYMNNCSVSDLSELETMYSLDYIDLKNSIFSGNDNLKILEGLREKKSTLKLYLKRL